jgi:hypothetical protein
LENPKIGGKIVHDGDGREADWVGLLSYSNKRNRGKDWLNRGGDGKKKPLGAWTW